MKSVSKEKFAQQLKDGKIEVENGPYGPGKDVFFVRKGKTRFYLQVK